MNRESLKGTGRRGFLKGAGAVGVAGVVGVGAMSYSAEPVVAAENGFEVEDITVEVSDGELSSLGVTDAWFNLEWQAINYDRVEIQWVFETSEGDAATTFGRAGTVDNLGIAGSGEDSWGFGDQYEEEYENELTIEDFSDEEEFPIDVTRDEDEDFLDIFSVEQEGDTEEYEVSFGPEFWGVTEEGDYDLLGSEKGDFMLTVDWVEADATVTEGAADASGED